MCKITGKPFLVCLLLRTCLGTSLSGCPGIGHCRNEHISLLQVSVSTHRKNQVIEDPLELVSDGLDASSDGTIQRLSDSGSNQKSAEGRSKGVSRESTDAKSTGEAQETRVIEITEKPQGDSRMYQGAVLANGLQVLNIQDNSSVQSAMAMAVMSGSYNDPEELPGLAHFCEHMLFLGSKKYPNVDEWDRFLNKYGGGSNAYTDSEVTNYYFEASATAAMDAMPRFADWFSEPLFNRTYVDKEVHAIDSEHAKNVQDPTWRIWDTMLHMANPDSPVSRFHTGNVNTLMTNPKQKGIDTIDALHKYFDAHYCAPKMRLVTFGPMPIQEQFEATKAAFNKIPRGSDDCQKKQSFASPEPWPANRLGKWVNVLNTNPKSYVYLMFPCPDLNKYYKSLPNDYLEYVFGYGGFNSLSMVLDDQLGLVGGIRFTPDTSSAGGRLILVFNPTPAGRKHIGLILDVIFAYISVLRHEGPNNKLYESLKDVAKLRWDWAGQNRPGSTVSDLAAKLVEAPLTDVLWAWDLVENLKPDVVKSLLELMRPDNMLVTFVDPGPEDVLFKGQIVETLVHYGVKYSELSLETALPGRAQKWDSWLSGHIPMAKVRDEINSSAVMSLGKQGESATELPIPPGPIVGVPKQVPTDNMHAKNLSGNETVGATEAIFGPFPEQLGFDAHLGEVWYRRGWVTKSPKVRMHTALRVLKHKDDPEDSSREEAEYALYATLLGKHLNPRLFDLSATGVDYEISPSTGGLLLAFSGFTPNMNQMIQAVLNQYEDFLKNGSKLTSTARYERAKELYKQSLESYSEMPVHYALQDRTMLVQAGQHSNEDILEALENTTLSSVLATGENALKLKPLKLQALTMGNMGPEDAQGILNQTISSVPGATHGLAKGATASGHFHLLAPIVKLSSPVELRKTNPRAADPNGVVVVTILHDVATVRSRVVYGILGNIISTTAYTELRTHRQLGYVVSAGALQLSNVMAISSTVQGDKLDADHMEGAVEAVYHKYMPQTLANLSDEDFKDYIASYRQRLTTPPSSDSDEFGSAWDGVWAAPNGHCRKLNDNLVSFLDREVTSKQVLIDAWKELLDPSSGMRRKIIVKYFAGDVPSRPSLHDSRGIWKDQGVPESSMQLLEREYNAVTQLKVANTAARAKLREAHGEYPTNIHCELHGEGTEASTEAKTEKDNYVGPAKSSSKETLSSRDSSSKRSSMGVGLLITLAFACML